MARRKSSAAQLSGTLQRRLLGAVLAEWRWAAKAAAFFRAYYLRKGFAAWAEQAAYNKVPGIALVIGLCPALHAYLVQANPCSSAPGDSGSSRVLGAG